MKIVSECRVVDGRMELKKRSTFLSDISQLKNGEYILTLEKKKKKRSIMQNGYYWGVVVPLVKNGLNDVGYRLTTEAVHEYLKGQFNICEIVNERSGELLKTIGSTTEMSTSQMMEYFARITQWAVEYLSIQIPEPNEQLIIE